MLTKPYRLVIGALGCLLLLALSARAQGPTTFESDVVGTTAASLQASTIALPVGGAATECTVTVEQAAIRYRLDGGALPTASTGLPANPYDIIQLSNPKDVAAFSFIAQTSSQALINVTCHGGTTAKPSSRVQGVAPGIIPSTSPGAPCNPLLRAAGKC